MANKPIPWEDVEIELLKEKYPILTKDELKKLFPDRSIKSVMGKAERLGLKKIGDLSRQNWTVEDVNIIKEYYTNSTEEEMLKLLPSRTWNEIQHKSSRLNIRKYREFKEDRHSWTENEIEQLVLDRSYIYHGTYFDDFNKRKIIVECEKGIIDHVYFNSFKNGSEAGSHNITRRKDYFEALHTIENEGYKVISSENGYKNSRSEINTICPNGHHYPTTLSNFNHGNRCQKCWLEEIGKANILSFELVKERFLEKGYTIIEEILEYNGSLQKIKCLCTHHISEESLYLSYNQVVNNNIKCKYCNRDKRIMNLKEKYDSIDDYFNINNLMLTINKGTYVKERLNLNADVELTFICTEHIHYGEQRILNRSFRFNGNPCRYCAKKQISGQNHYRWNGGLSNLSEFLRGKINKWKFDSLKNNNFKCFITGLEGNLVVHHVKPFSEIVKETVNELSLPSHQNISHYSENELNEISKLCIRKHYEYGLGIPLDSNIHDLFHEEYSVFYFDEDDFYEFIERFKGGEFNSRIKEVVESGS